MLPKPVFGVHSWTLLLFAGYGYGLRLVAQASDTPMWRFVSTAETRPDIPADNSGVTAVGRLWLRFVGFGALLATAGWLLGRAGETIAVETAVGVLLTGLASSLAELVVSLAAIRAGALTLAVGNIIGGNTFDTLFVGIADIAYRPGPIYGAVSEAPPLIAGFTTLATAVIVLGMLRRERHGIANIGMESAVVIAFYAVAVLLIL